MRHNPTDDALGLQGLIGGVPTPTAPRRRGLLGGGDVFGEVPEEGPGATPEQISAAEAKRERIAALPPGLFRLASVGHEMLASGVPVEQIPTKNLVAFMFANTPLGAVNLGAKALKATTGVSFLDRRAMETAARSIVEGGGLKVASSSPRAAVAGLLAKTGPGGPVTAAAAGLKAEKAAAALRASQGLKTPAAPALGTQPGPSTSAPSPRVRQGLNLDLAQAQKFQRRNSRLLEKLETGKIQEYPRPPSNERTVAIAPEGSGLPDWAFGKSTPDDWFNRISAQMSPQEIKHASEWYKRILPETLERVGGDVGKARRLMNAWMTSQQNASPRTAMNSALHQLEQLEAGVKPHRVVGLGLPGANRAALKMLIGGRVTKGVGPKIADFLDAADQAHLPPDAPSNLRLRSIMNYHPDGGSSFVVDIWTARDMGAVDQTFVNHLRSKGYTVPESVNIDFTSGADGGGIPKNLYENLARRGREITEVANARGWQGRKDWQPHEIQAIGWENISRTFGVPAQGGDVVASFNRNVRSIAMEAKPGDGSPFASKFGQRLKNLPEDLMRDVDRVFTQEVLDLVERRVGPIPGITTHATGGWQLDPPQFSTVRSGPMSREGAGHMANLIGLYMHQSEVWVNSITTMTKSPTAWAIDILERGLNSTKLRSNSAVAKLWNQIMEKDKSGFIQGYQPLEMADGRIGIRILVNQGGKKVKAYLENDFPGVLSKAVKDLPYQVSVNIRAAEIKVYKNDWNKHPDGKTYTDNLGNFGRSTTPGNVGQVRHLDGQKLEESFEQLISEAEARHREGLAAQAVDLPQQGLLGSAPPTDPTALGGILSAKVGPGGAIAAITAGLRKAPLDAQGFSSKALDSVMQLKQLKGTPQQMMSQLLKAGAKPAELEAMRIPQFLAGKTQVTQAEIFTHMMTNRVRIRRLELGSQATKHAKWQMDGGDNYREILWTLPDGASPATFRVSPVDEGFNVLQRLDGVDEIVGRHVTQRTAEIDMNRHRRTAGFVGEHFPDQRNIIAHTRVNDRVDPQGNRMMFVEEFQSDWWAEAWAIRKTEVSQLRRIEGLTKKEANKRVPGDFGFRTDVNHLRVLALRARDARLVAGIRDAGERGPNNPRDLFRELNLVRTELASINPMGAVPPAPFVTQTNKWVEFSIKHLLKEAVDGGYHSIAWTPGHVQIARYQLSQRVSKITWSPIDGSFSAYDLDGRIALQKSRVKAEDLDELLGTEVADRLRSSEPARGTKALPNSPTFQRLEGLDLDMGGEGMKKFYDGIIPNVGSRIIKKLDPTAKVGRTKLDAPDENMPLTVLQEDNLQALSLRLFNENFDDLTTNQMNTVLKQVRAAELEVQRIVITDKMRDKIEAGLELFSAAPAPTGLLSTDDADDTDDDFNAPAGLKQLLSATQPDHGLL